MRRNAVPAARKRRTIRAAIGAVGWLAASPPAAALAQATPEPAPAATPGDAAIQAALAADQPPPGNAPAAPPTPATGGVVPNSANLFNPSISVIPSFIAAYYSDPSYPGFEWRNGFQIEELEIALSGSVDPYFRFDAFPSIGRAGVDVEEAYATTLALPWNLEARVGKFLMPFGRLNPMHRHLWSFVEAPFWFSSFLSSDSLHGTGASVNWLAPFPFYLKVIATVQQAYDNGVTFSGAAPAYRMLYGGRIETFLPFGDEWSTLAGISVLTGPSLDAPDGAASLFGADLYVRYKPVRGASFFELGWSTEAVRRIYPTPLGGGVGPVATPWLEDWGVSSELAIRFAQRWKVAGRYDVLGLEGSVGSLLWDQRASTSLTFSPTEFSRLRAEYDATFPHVVGLPIHAAFLKAEFSMGAHGAHPF